MKIAKQYLLSLFIIITLQANAQVPELWGMTSEGGKYGAGTIFKTDSNGNNHSVEYSMYKHEGRHPNGSLIQATNGKFYGLIGSGGANQKGILFEYDASTNIFIKKIDFGGKNIGRYPNGNLVQATNGKLYGLTRGGGKRNEGVLFEYDISTNIYTKKRDFDVYTIGGYPYGNLIQATNGKMYGLTKSGGTTGSGTLFEYDINTNTFAKKIDFDLLKGRNPLGSLMQATNGKLYGYAIIGGAIQFGILFEYDISTNILIKKLEFRDKKEGLNPSGTPIQAANGLLYGLMSDGGLYGSGVLFEYDILKNSYSKKIDFEDETNGRRPLGSLIQATNGRLYGLTSKGGIRYSGVVFEYDISSNILRKKNDFDKVNNGRNPVGSLIQAKNRKLYGLTLSGGTNNMGVLFECDTRTDFITKKIDFNGSKRANNPQGSLMQASNTKLYGLTSQGGVNSKGTLFEYDASTSTFTKKIDFDGENRGQTPKGNLIQASNGKLYGLTTGGGKFNLGVLFEYDVNTNTFIKKIDFDGTNRGSNPQGSLIQTSNGKLYGLTYKGGTNNSGVLFEYDISTNLFIKKIDFDGKEKGAYPFGSLIQSVNGKLYGLTNVGGIGGYGVLFEYDASTNTFTKKMTFHKKEKGENPFGSLIQATNGKLYGLTSGYGVLFEYDLFTSIYSKKTMFGGKEKGMRPNGSLFQASNGKMYGLTKEGGLYKGGILFEYDVFTNTFIKKLDFNWKNGACPAFTHLIEIKVAKKKPIELVKIYPNPNAGTVNVNLGNLKNVSIKIYNIEGKLVYSENDIKTQVYQFKLKVKSGIYLVKIVSDKGKQELKLIIE